MGIQRLEISGFRSLADVIWEPGPLNVLIGPNGSGKSNLLRALQLLKAAAEGRLSKTVLSWGGMVPLLWDGQVHTIRFGLQFGWLAYEFSVEQLGQSGAFRIGKEVFGSYRKDEFIKAMERTSTRAVFFRLDADPTQVAWEATEEKLETLVKEDETLLGQLTIHDLNSTASDLYAQLKMADYSIYHDVRVDQESEMRRAVVSRRDTRVESDGSNLISVMHTLYTTDRDFKEDVNLAMKAAFGDEFEELVFPPAEDGRVQLRVRWHSLKREQSASDLSDGMLRFLFLITVLAGSDPLPLIAIDEPETGLHPSMLPIVAEYAAEAANHTQVILTTHSPQFLNAFSHRADIATLMEWRDGQTHLRRLPEEKLAHWLEDYQLGELFASGELEGIA